MNWYLDALKNYAVFQGRSRRAAYWYFALFNLLAGILLSIIDRLLGTVSAQGGAGLLYSFYWLSFCPAWLFLSGDCMTPDGVDGGFSWP